MTNSSYRLVKLSAVMAGVLLSGVTSVFGQLAATATISSVPSGGNFDYTILLTDTGTTNIGTFWFAWTPPGQPVEYDFLPSLPLSTSQPAGWIGFLSPGSPGNSIEYYNNSGSDISPGQTATFHFTSSDTPAQLHGLVFGFLPVTESFVYSGVPTSAGDIPLGTPAKVNPAFVPEPSTLLLTTLGAVALLACRRRCCAD